MWSNYETVSSEEILVCPNPAVGVDHVVFSKIPSDSRVLKIYNIAGELVKVLYVNGQRNPRWYLDNSYAKPVASGVYIVQTESSKGVSCGKFVVVR